ncbi:MAG: SNF2 family helicase [Simkaniaceae bacterium]|nr:SNF2 family helicase [Simkaniaceae bacterium]
MLNLRKLKQDFSSSVLKEGKRLFDDAKVVSAKILHIDASLLRINAKIVGQYENTYESEIEIDRTECETIDSDCDCPYHYDCQHLAALLYYLEANIDRILVEYSQETDLHDLAEKSGFDEGQKEELLGAVQSAVDKETERKEAQYQKELMQEYTMASEVLSRSPFFLVPQKKEIDPAELAIIFNWPEGKAQERPLVEIQFALRLPSRSKPLHIPHAKEFLESLRHQEVLAIGGKRYLFTVDSFKEDEKILARMLVDHARAPEKASTERGLRSAFIELKSFGLILAETYRVAVNRLKFHGSVQDGDLPCIYEKGLESPLQFSSNRAVFQIGLEYLNPPASKILLNPTINIDGETVMLEEVNFLECAEPGMIHKNIYYRFSPHITRQHLRSLHALREITIPEPLFGTFVENALPEVARFADISDEMVTDKFTTLPYAGPVQGICDISYLDGELEAVMKFKYDDFEVPSATKKLRNDHLMSFVSNDGILARNLTEERELLDNLFQDFLYNEDTGTYVAKTEKKIIEFMTDTVPRHQDRVTFNCPQNLLDQFIYDQSTFGLELSHLGRMDAYKMKIAVNGDLKGVTMDQLWECLLSRRSFLELERTRTKKKGEGKGRIPKILVLDLDRLGAVVQLFDELGIQKLDNHTLERPLWSLANIDKEQFKDLPVEFSMTKQLVEIRKQMLGEKLVKFSPIPKALKATLRPYQMEGVNWLERLRMMFLNGVLADDMGLGKTLQAIASVTQMHKKGETSLVICPTSLLYNWKEEICKFNPKLKALIVDGIPAQRKKLIAKAADYDIVITSYSLLQKDVEQYNETQFAYMILDEAQHIKNRGTRNAKSVKMVKADHKVILSGTPIENSLDELWSLFDFLMPGFLGSYDRFVEKYIRVARDEQAKNLAYLRKKVSPFIMRRMKEDVLDDLPPAQELTYHCSLSDTQKELYKSYADSARDELTKLVERDGFDKVQIHVLATLTRLKQICCHPAIFAKQDVEENDSAKYDMLMELLQTLIEGKHKTVIFSQYTKMLRILRSDLEKQGIRFCYLDGSSKNRLDIVNKFNDDETIPVFLVSLKAGGTGLNLVGADTVIHYDMWWNPAVESQATDRVHRMGQKKSVSVYKLVTLSTIEEKIVEMQRRKQGLVKKIVSCDEEAISKLTWEDVLELLQT